MVALTAGASAAIAAGPPAFEHSERRAQPRSVRRPAAARVAAYETIPGRADLRRISLRSSDSAPCGQRERVSWTRRPVQTCPLTAPMRGGQIPVYEHPEAAGSRPVGSLHSTAGQRFVCQKRIVSAEYVHPAGWRNRWWAYTLSDDDHWGWVPEVFFAGGRDDEPDSGLRICPPRRRASRRARVSLHGSPARLRNGQTLVMHGALLSHPFRPGVVLALEAQLSPRHWRPFGIAVTDRRGRFQARYRFTRTTRTQTYRLRVVVPSQRGYALGRGVSRPIFVVVGR